MLQDKVYTYYVAVFLSGYCAPVCSRNIHVGGAAK